MARGGAGRSNIMGARERAAIDARKARSTIIAPSVSLDAALGIIQRECDKRDHRWYGVKDANGEQVAMQLGRKIEAEAVAERSPAVGARRHRGRNLSGQVDRAGPASAMSRTRPYAQRSGMRCRAISQRLRHACPAWIRHAWATLDSVLGGHSRAWPRIASDGQSLLGCEPRSVAALQILRV